MPQISQPMNPDFTSPTGPLSVNKLTMDDVMFALRAGIADFAAARADVILIALVYPLIGLLVITMGLSMNLLPLIVPCVTGFAILGPVASVGLYEISRLREAGENPDWLDAFGVTRSPAFPAIIALGAYLATLFVTWIVTAQAIYDRTLGPEPPVSISGFVADTVFTASGWAMIGIGTTVGAVFAFAALATSFISFPLLLDRNTGLLQAIHASFQLVQANPTVTLAWGVLIGSVLFLASLPLLLGLIVALPILGHATWHLYRRALG